MWWWLTWLSLGGSALMVLVLDNPTIPAWRSRLIYKTAYLVVTGVALFACTKALLYREELRMLIQQCR